MKRIKNILPAIVILILTCASVSAIAQSAEPWTSKDLMEPAALASMISSKDAMTPVILNIGPLADIKGAIHIGPVNNAAGLEKMKKALAGVTKDKTVVIYCGCCPFRNCPNIRPAFSLLKEQGYKNPKLLNLKQNLKVDWASYGYPME